MQKILDALGATGWWLVDHPKVSFFLAGLALGFTLGAVVL